MLHINDVLYVIFLISCLTYFWICSLMLFWLCVIFVFIFSFFFIFLHFTNMMKGIILLQPFSIFQPTSNSLVCSCSSRTPSNNRGLKNKIKKFIQLGSFKCVFLIKAFLAIVFRFYWFWFCNLFGFIFIPFLLSLLYEREDLQFKVDAKGQIFWET